MVLFNKTIVLHANIERQTQPFELCLLFSAGQDAYNIPRANTENYYF